MKPAKPKSQSNAVFGIGVALICLPCSGQAIASDYEPETNQFQASDFIDKALLKGPNHEIDGTVVNRGFMNHYRIKTPYGEVLVSGDRRLANAVHEIDAAQTLRETSKAEVIAESAVEAVTKPIEAAKQVVENPVETVKGIPAGIGRLFGRAKDVAKDVSEKSQQADAGDSQGQGETEKPEESLAERFMGVGSAHRKLASDLKVDPYSTNELLQAELSNLAKYAGAASFATNLVVPSIPGVGMVANVSGLVWNLSARDLKLRNQKSLASMGAGEALIENFYDNPNYTPTDQTRLVTSLERLQDVGGRAIIMDKAIAAETHEEALAYVRLSEMLAAYHHGVNPISEIIETQRRIPIARTGKGKSVLMAPVDYVPWSKPAEEAARELLKSGGQGNELWLEGRASKLARSQLENLGWKVIEDAYGKLDDKTG